MSNRRAVFTLPNCVIVFGLVCNLLLINDRSNRLEHRLTALETNQKLIMAFVIKPTAIEVSAKTPQLVMH